MYHNSVQSFITHIDCAHTLINAYTVLPGPKAIATHFGITGSLLWGFLFVMVRVHVMCVQNKTKGVHAGQINKHMPVEISKVQLSIRRYGLI